MRKIISGGYWATARRVLLLVWVGGVAACGSTGASPSPGADGVEPSPEILESFRVGTLSGRALAAEDCGLFLFDIGAERRLVLFAKNGAASAQMVIDGAERSFGLTRTGGSLFAGQFTEQDFTDRRRDLAVSVGFERGEPLEGGQSVPAGTIRLTHRSGWEQVIPVAGVIACGLPSAS